jgi:MFS transporter, ACS family, solute carrier family 17 (sodium-dependent inorganic phosphate cotransporter), other
MVVGMTFLGCVIAYTDRVNISVAAVAMKEHFGWSQTEKGIVLSAFFVGYMLCMFVAGLLATRFGGKLVATSAVLIWSIFTLLTPLAANLSMPALIGARVAMGMGEAGLFPATYELFSRWVPLIERARAAGRFVSGIPLGTVIGLTASAWLVAHSGWPMPFYVFGILGLLWMSLWFRHVKNDPRDDPGVGADERDLLDTLRGADSPTEVHVPFRQLLCRWPVFAVLVGQFASAWTLYVRKLMQCGGLIASAGFLLASRAAHSPAAALALLIGATAALGVTWCGFAPGILDIAPRHCGVMVGFTNTIGQIPGIIGVAVTGWLVDITGTYSAAFVFAAAISVAGAVVFGSLFNARPLIE